MLFLLKTNIFGYSFINVQIKVKVLNLRRHKAILMEEKDQNGSVNANTGFGAFFAASGKGSMPELSTFKLKASISSVNH